MEKLVFHRIRLTGVFSGIDVVGLKVIPLIKLVLLLSVVVSLPVLKHEEPSIFLSTYLVVGTTHVTVLNSPLVSSKVATSPWPRTEEDVGVFPGTYTVRGVVRKEESKNDLDETLAKVDERQEVGQIPTKAGKDGSKEQQQEEEVVERAIEIVRRSGDRDVGARRGKVFVGDQRTVPKSIEVTSFVAISPLPSTSEKRPSQKTLRNR
nr:hypothetical protein HmN_000946600 [Hymenolepis microstoma]